MNADPGTALNAVDRVIEEASPNELPGILAYLASQLAKVAARQMTDAHEDATPADRPDENINVTEAARRLGMSKSWIYKNARKLPFIIPIGRRLVFSARGLERWSRQRQGAAARGVGMA